MAIPLATGCACAGPHRTSATVSPASSCSTITRMGRGNCQPCLPPYRCARDRRKPVHPITLRTTAPDLYSPGLVWDHRAAGMPDKPTITERIDRVLTRHGITQPMVRAHIATHYGWFREFSPTSTHFRASEVAALLELLDANRQHPIAPPVFPSDFLTAYEVAWLVFRGSRQISWITQRLPAGFPPRDPASGCWKRAEVEAWLSENLTTPRKAQKAPGKPHVK